MGTETRPDEFCGRLGESVEDAVTVCQFSAILLNVGATAMIAWSAFRLPTGIAEMHMEEASRGPRTGEERFRQKAETAGGLVLLMISLVFQTVVLGSPRTLKSF